jgi:ABC-type multidrug transport system permease subunit
MMAIVLASAARNASPAELHRSAIGFFAWMLFAMVGMSGVEAVTGAAAGGTLEKMLSGPMRHVTIILGEIISSAIIGLLRWSIVFAVLAAILRISVPVSVPALLTLALLIVFLLALGVGLSAAGLVARRTFDVSSYLQLAMLGLALVASSSSSFARPLELFPFTLAIRLLDGAQIGVGDLAVLAAGTLLTAIGAGIAFVYADRRALRLGLLSVY